MNVYYIGCIGRAGHFPWKSDTERVRFGEMRDILQRSDGFFAPLGSPAPDGLIARHYVHGFTILSWWDSVSVDTRPGSNATFWVEGKHTAIEALRIAKERFPKVFEQTMCSLRLPEDADRTAATRKDGA